ATRPRVARAVLLLPQPASPTIPIALPGGTSNDTSWTTVVPPMVTVSPCTERTGTTPLPGCCGGSSATWWRGRFGNSGGEEAPGLLARSLHGNRTPPTH